MFPVFGQLFKALDIYINNSYDKELTKEQIQMTRDNLFHRQKENG
jgi:hypothetical protein